MMWLMHSGIIYCDESGVNFEAYVAFNVLNWIKCNLGDILWKTTNIARKYGFQTF